MKEQRQSAPANGKPVLELRGVTKCFGGVTAVRDVSFSLTPGHVTSLIGPNGAGNTTLFNAVTGCIPATRGEIVFHGRHGPRRIERLRPDQINRLGIARTFQNIRLFSNLTVLDNVKVGFHTRTHAAFLGAVFRPPGVRREERRIEASALEYLEFCSLSHVENEIAGSLPYGYQRRLEIARALATAPSLLLLDEPAAGMNPAESDELLALIRSIIQCGITVFLIEHDMRVVMNISDTIHVLEKGRIVESGAHDDLVARKGLYYAMWRQQIGERPGPPEPQRDSLGRPPG